jgi:hypothetical protein
LPGKCGINLAGGKKMATQPVEDKKKAPNNRFIGVKVFHVLILLGLFVTACFSTLMYVIEIFNFRDYSSVSLLTLVAWIGFSVYFSVTEVLPWKQSMSR